MSIKEFLEIKQVDKLTDTEKSLFQKYHTSKRWETPAKYKFILTDIRTSTVIGAALFGHPTSSRAKNVYGEDILELKKFVTIDNTEKNTESYFLSRCMKSLKLLGYKRFLTYADPREGHTGGLYKACNFVSLGQGKANYIYVPKGKTKKDLKRKVVQERQVYTKIKGDYSPAAKQLQFMVRAGKLIRKMSPGKLIFMFEFSA
jgi:hypothetical protein